MAKLLRLRRGTSTQHTTFTGAEGEVTVNTTNDSLHVHDGATAGGTELAKADLSNVSGSLNNNLGFADNVKARFGTGNDLEIYHNGSHNYIDGAEGQNIYISAGDHVVIRNGATDETSAKFLENGKVELRYDNAIKFETTSTGIDVTGTVSCDSFSSPTTVSAGSYGSASAIPNFTVDSSGRLTAAGSSALNNASETVSGIVELATAAETTTGTATTRAVHPAGLKVELDKKLNKNISSLPTLP